MCLFRAIIICLYSYLLLRVYLFSTQLVISFSIFISDLFALFTNIHSNSMIHIPYSLQMVIEYNPYETYLSII